MLPKLCLPVLLALAAHPSQAAILYVADSFAGTVSTVTESGVIGPFLSALTYPKALATYGSVLFVASGDEILRFDLTTGTPLGSLGTLIGVDSVVVDLLGNVFAASSTAQTVQRYDVGGGAPLEITGLDSVSALALDANGHLFFTYNDSVVGMQGVRHLASDLSFVDVFVAGHADFSMPSSAHYRSDGSLLITDLFTGIHHVDAMGNRTLFTVDVTFPWGIAVDADGKVYAASNTMGSIEVFSSTGTALGTFVAGFSEPTGIAFSPVPEPGTFAMLGGALAAVAASRAASRASTRRG
jgi:PEP-CTERM motif